MRYLRLIVTVTTAWALVTHCERIATSSADAAVSDEMTQPQKQEAKVLADVEQQKNLLTLSDSSVDATEVQTAAVTTQRNRSRKKKKKSKAGKRKKKNNKKAGRKKKKKGKGKGKKKKKGKKKGKGKKKKGKKKSKRALREEYLGGGADWRSSLQQLWFGTPTETTELCGVSCFGSDCRCDYDCIPGTNICDASCEGADCECELFCEEDFIHAYETEDEFEDEAEDEFEDEAEDEFEDEAEDEINSELGDALNEFSRPISSLRARY